MMDWLFAPMDATAGHEIGWHLSWHARSMVLAWGILAPLGVIVARYFKILPGQNWPHTLDSRLWWITHRVCQYSACALMVIGIFLILSAPAIAAKEGPHALLGWTVLALVTLQVASGLFRGSKGGPTDPAPDGSNHGDHFDMSPRRRVFEYVHKTTGYLVLLLSAITILFGLWQANAPNWMWLSLTLWWATLGFVSVILQRKGMAVDTYQAIWGPDPSLPGHSVKPIGFGISRRGDEADDTSLHESKPGSTVSRP